MPVKEILHRKAGAGDTIGKGRWSTGKYPCTVAARSVPCYWANPKHRGLQEGAAVDFEWVLG